MTIVLQSLSLLAQVFALFYATRLLRLVGRPKAGSFITIAVGLLAVRTLLELATNQGQSEGDNRHQLAELAYFFSSCFLAVGAALLRSHARRRALARLDPNESTSLTAGPPKEKPEPREEPEPSADVSTEPLLVCNADMEIVEANQGACRLLGREQKDVYGKSVANLVRKEEMLLVPELFRLARTGESQGGEWTFRRPDDSLVPVRVTTHCRFQDSVRLTLQDITEERAAQKASVNESGNAGIIEQLLDASPDGYVAYDPELKIVAWNTAMEGITGIPRIQCLNQHLLMHFPIPDELAENDFFLEALEGHSHDLRGATLLNPETGESESVDHHFAPLTNSAGEIIGGMVVVRDAQPAESATPPPATNTAPSQVREPAPADAPADTTATETGNSNDEPQPIPFGEDLTDSENLVEVSLSDFLSGPDEEPDQTIPTSVPTTAAAPTTGSAPVSDEFRLIETALDAAPHVIAVYDLFAGQTVFANRPLPAVVGFSENQIADMGDDYLTEIVHPEDLSNLPRAVEDWNDGTGIELRITEFRVADPQLNWRWFQSADRVLSRDEEGNVFRIVSIIEDITDRKEAERDLRLGEQKYLTFSEHCPTGIWHLTAGGTTHYLNPAMCRILGVASPADMQDRTWHEFITEESRQRLANESGGDAEGGASTWPIEICRADGGNRRCLLHGTPDFDEHGELRGLMASVVDISEQAATGSIPVDDVTGPDERESLLAEHDSRVQELEAQLEAAHDKLTSIADDLNERDTHLEELRGRLVESEQAGSRVDEIERRLTDSNGRLEERENRIQELEERLAEVRTKLGEAEGNLTERETRIETLQTRLGEAEQSTEQISDLEQQLAASATKLDERETQLSEHGSRIQTLEGQLSETETKLRETEDGLLDGEARLEELTAKLHESEKTAARIGGLEERLGERDRRVEELQTDLGSRDARIIELESQLRDRDSRISDLSTQIGDRDTRVSDLEGKLGDARTRIEESAAELQTHEVRIGEHNARSRELEGQLKERNSRIEELEGRLRDEQWHLGERDARIQQLETELHRDREKLQETEARLTEIDRQLADRDTRINEFEKRLGETESRLSETGGRLAERDARITDLEGQLGDRETRIADLDSQLAEHATRITGLETQLGERDSRIGDLEAQADDRAARVSELEDRLGERDTELAQRESRLTELSAHLETSAARIDSLHDCVWTLDTELRCDFLNRAWRERTGCGQDEDLGDRWRDRIFGQDRDRVIRILRAAIEKREAASFDCRLSAGSGEYRWVRCHIRPRQDTGNHLPGLIASATDIHDHMTAEQDLRTTLRWHEWAQKSARLGSWEYHPKDDSGFWNDTSLELIRLAGRPSPERINDFLAQVHPDDRSKISETNQQVLKTGQSVTQHLFRTNPDHGPVRRLSASIHRAPEEDGSAYFLVGTLLDVTSLQPATAIAPVRAAEPVATRGDDRYRRIVELAGHGVWMMDAEGYTSFVNPAMIRLLGRKYREFVGRHFFEFLESESTTEAEAFLERRAEGISEQTEFSLVHRAGQKVTALLTTSPLKDDDGEIIGCLCMVTDISGIREQEGAHSETESRSRAVLDSAPGYIMTVDEKKFVRYANRALPGISVKQLVGTPLLNWASPADRDDFDEALDQVFNTGRETAIEFRGLGPDEETVRYAARIAPIHKGGEIVSLSVVTQILGERPADNLGDFTRQLLAAQEDERRRLAAELHDLFGQSLSATKLNLEALPDDLSKPARKRVTDCLESVERLITRTRDLGGELRPSVLDDLGLEPALRWLVGHRADSAGFTASFEADKLPRLGQETETAAYRVVETALDNIAAHAKAKNVAVELRRSDDRLLITVSDDGKGFNPDKLKPARRPGLNYMTERARLLGGELEIDAKPRKGATVTASLPLTKAKSRSPRRRK